MIFQVREASVDDLEPLVSLTMAEAAEAEGRELSPKVLRIGIKTGIENPEVARYWILEHYQAGVIGSISIVKEWSDWRAGYYWWIQSLFIAPEFRGQGFLSHLLAAVKEKARLENAVELRLYVHQDNERAIRAYHRAGFLETPYRVLTTFP
jgi:GNAT superfamily N-acetyltransferase